MRPRLLSAQANATSLVTLTFDQSMDSSNPLLLDVESYSFDVESIPSISSVAHPTSTTVELTLSAPMLGGQVYNVTVNSGLTNLLFQTMNNSGLTAEFVGIGSQPQIISISNITNNSIRVEFSQPMNDSVGNPNNYSIRSRITGAFVGISASTPINATTVVLSLSTKMSNGGDHELNVRDVFDYVGNLCKISRFDFIGVADDISVVDVTYSSESGITITFDSKMNPDFLGLDSFSIVPSSGFLSAHYTSVERISDFEYRLPTTLLRDGETYTVTATSTVVDAYGNDVDVGANSGSIVGVGSPLSILRVDSVGQNRINVVFNRAVYDGPSSRDETLYTADGGLNIVSVVGVNGSEVQLVTSDQTEELIYTLTVDTTNTSPPEAITDLVGNHIVVGNQQFVGFVSDTTNFETNKIYESQIEGIRRADVDLFWKRFCGIFEQSQAQMAQKFSELETLWSNSAISDKYLGLLKLRAGWTSEFDSITDKLDSTTLRQLIEESPNLWKRRGAAGAVAEVLKIIVGVQPWIRDWFDLRWIESANLSQVSFLSRPSRTNSVLWIEDPLLDLDRDLVTDVVKAWSVIGEKTTIVFVDFFDNFRDASKGWNTYDGTVLVDTNISSGALIVDADSRIQYAFPEDANLSDEMQNYSFTARILYDQIASSVVDEYFGVCLRFSGDFNTLVELRISPWDPLQNTHPVVGLYQNGALIPGTSAVSLSDFGVLLYPNLYNDVKVSIFRQPGTTIDSVEFFLNGNLIYAIDLDSVFDQFGIPGIFHGVGLGVRCSNFEIMPLPCETREVSGD